MTAAVEVGIDAHKRTHTLVAVDGSRSQVGEKNVLTITAGTGSDDVGSVRP